MKCLDILFTGFYTPYNKSSYSQVYFTRELSWEMDAFPGDRLLWGFFSKEVVSKHLAFLVWLFFFFILWVLKSTFQHARMTALVVYYFFSRSKPNISIFNIAWHAAWVSVFWVISSTFSHIWSEYGEILRISPYSVRMWENTDQKNSEYGHFMLW